jgi:protein-S-isoprenylcysteine O-methyltransferase Ste14
MTAPRSPSSRRVLWAAAGSLTFLVLAPGVVGGLIPWWLTGWEVYALWLPFRVAGALLIVGGTVALLHAFSRFVVEGIGTPAPVAPTDRLVVGGLYRHVRNPMYLAVEATIVGQALFLGQPALVLYAGVVWLAVAAFVYGYEEPTLADRFGDEYEAYRDAVPAWLPRMSAWRGVGVQAVRRDAEGADGRRRRRATNGR